jgi:hypothetical protein
MARNSGQMDNKNEERQITVFAGGAAAQCMPVCVAFVASALTNEASASLYIS